MHHIISTVSAYFFLPTIRNTGWIHSILYNLWIPFEKEMRVGTETKETYFLFATVSFGVGKTVYSKKKIPKKWR